MAKDFWCTATEPVVTTKYGRLRGFRLGDTYHFYGIKYADAKRFQMPKEVEPWDGIKDALSYGYVCPVLDKEVPDGGASSPPRFWPKDENCQYLNIWTPSLKKDAKKAVIVWIHGGVFSDGSSIKRDAYDGRNLSEFGDIVVVSLNHRLNILGYLDLSAFGEKYWNTPNLGQADLVAALRWIHDNIESFGGDPENVTLLGQSGGGGKINALLQTPAADHLFQRCIIQSGLWADEGLAHCSKEGAKLLIEEMISYLGTDQVEVLETVSYEKLAEAYHAGASVLRDKGYAVGLTPIQNDWYKGNSLNIGFLPGALARPVVAGTIFAEFCPGFQVKDKNTLSEEQRYAIVKEKYGENTEEILSLFKEAYPDKNIIDATAVDTFFREPAMRWLDAKAKAGGEKTYAFVFAPDFTIDGGKPAWHGAEIPFAFHNVDKAPAANIPCADQLEKEMAGAWVAFAKTGNPNHPALVEWPAYETGSEYIMVFSEHSEAKLDFDRKLVERLEEIAPTGIAKSTATK